MSAATATSARIIDGRSLASTVRTRLRERIDTLRRQGRGVRLDAVLCGSDGPSGVYAHNQQATCEELGIEYVLHTLPKHAKYEDVAGRVLLLNADENVSAIMVHLPLSEGVDTERIQSLIAVEKDVEGVNPANIGNVVYGRRSLVPCTALAVIEMIESTGVQLRGKLAVCVGASNIVGKPVVVLLMREEATVISCNKFTQDMQAITRQADILVSAAGVPSLIKGAMLKPGAVVIDVGINHIKDSAGKKHTVGDVDFESACKVAGWLSPVPGGVGPMTVAMLLRNTVQAAER